VSAYILFAGYDYEACGGAWDCIAVRPTLEEARQEFHETRNDGRHDWAHIATVSEDGLNVCWYWDRWKGERE
jgi:hypothetical protein